MDVFLLSGLGADRRVFNNLHLQEHSVEHIKWLQPMKGEPIEQYARRLLPQVDKKNPVLIGVSFGGMIALEIAKQIETRQVVLISSAKTFRSVPFFYRLIGTLKLHLIVPAGLLKQVNFLSYYLFGITRRADKELFKEIMKDTDTRFLRWAIDKVVTWRFARILKNVHTIHGSDDRILPLRESDHVIEGGGHFMIVDRADEISAVLRKILVTE